MNRMQALELLKKLPPDELQSVIRMLQETARTCTLLLGKDAVTNAKADQEMAALPSRMGPKPDPKSAINLLRDIMLEHQTLPIKEAFARARKSNPKLTDKYLGITCSTLRSQGFLKRPSDSVKGHLEILSLTN